jgi:hypothetical protein
VSRVRDVQGSAHLCFEKRRALSRSGIIFSERTSTMAIVPADRLGKIQFYENHLTPWEANVTAIGLTTTELGALTTLVEAARAAYDAAEAARQASKAATLAYHNAVTAMHSGPGAGADMIEKIKNKAATTNNPDVYALAEIPAPATPGTVPPPGTPFMFTVGLLQSGAIELKWKCENPSGTSGTIYEIKRTIGSGPSATTTFVGATGVKSFIDDTLPVGSSPVTYQITAVRSTTRGNPAQFTVSFGIVSGGGGGMFVASVNEGSSPLVKMAA